MNKRIWSDLLPRSSRRHRRYRRLWLESLESRVLLSLDQLIGPEPRSDSLAATIATPLPDNVASNLAALYYQASVTTATVPGATAMGSQADPAPASGKNATTDLVQTDAQGRPLVDIWTREGTGTVLPELEALGVEILDSNEEYRLIEAWLDLGSLGTIAQLPGVLSLTPVYRPIQRAGAVQTQGDAVIHADDVRAAGYDGSQILVGVLSDSALNIAASQATGDLPPVVDRYLEFPASDEGRAMLEIVHDVAPGAQLAHHSAIYGESSFAGGIRELAAAGAKVICDDDGYLTEPFFQDGIIAQAVNDVVNSYGVTYVSAAGNDADRSYEADFTDAGGGYHDFDPSAAVDTKQQVTVTAGGTATLILQWDDPFYTTSGVTQDFNVKVYTGAGVEVAVGQGMTNNLSTQQPLEVLSWTASGTGIYQVEIQRLAGTGSSRLKYLFNGTVAEYSTHSGTVVGHPAAAGAIAVGAVPYNDPSNIESFSSHGDATIYFDPTGARLATPEVRQKPDVVAPDKVSTTVFASFSGTSASAPHVAGEAALLLDANPHLTRSELYNAITSTALDLGTPGRDAVYGFGRVDASAALAAALATPDVTPPTATMTSPIPVHGWDVSHMDLQFSEPLSPSVATNTANYSLVGAGADAMFGTSDDVSYTLAAAYTDETRIATLTFTAPVTELASGQYRLTLRAAGLHDPAGNPLSGGSDMAFPLTLTGKSAIAGATTNFDLRSDGSATMVYAITPVMWREYWPQVLVGQFGEGGQSQGPFRCFLPSDFESYSHGIAYPDVAVSDSGGVVVYDDWQGPESGFDQYEIHFQLLDTNGRPQGNDTYVTSAWGNSNWVQPNVDMNATGDFAFVWHSMLEPGTGADVHYAWAAIFDAQGHAKAGPFPVTPGGGFTPAVAMAADGSVVFVFEGSDADGSGVFVRRFDPHGNVLGQSMRVSSGSASLPGIDMAADGSFVVVWTNGSTYCRRYNVLGQPLGPEQLAFASQGGVVAMAADGRFVVVTPRFDGDGTGIFAQRFASDGALVGDAIWVSEGASGSQTSPHVAVKDNGDFLVTWQDSGSKARWISWKAEDDVLPYGPMVRTMSPSSITTGPVSSVDVTFDRPINGSTFTVSKVSITDRLERPVAVNSVTTNDNRTFTINFESQQLPGTYRVYVGPDVEDTLGRKMDQNKNAVNGEVGDNFYETFAIDAESAAFPVTERFEYPNTDVMPTYWSLYKFGGSLSIVTTLPHSGNSSLQMSTDQNYVYKSQAAFLKVDLSQQATSQDLELDFWIRGWGSTNPSNTFVVEVSGDGVSWKNLSGTIEPARLSKYTHYVFDLDATLATARVASDTDVYLRFMHTGYMSGQGMTLDDVRVSNVDARGPKVTAFAPTGQVVGSVSSLDVTFDERIDASTFTTADVSVSNSGGTSVTLAGNPVDSGDGKTFAINFAAPQVMPGTYSVRIGPNVLDVNSNQMNQNQDAINGDPIYDVKSWTFEVGGLPVPQQVPYVQSFESGDLGSLPGWSVNRTSGTIGISNANAKDGMYALELFDSYNHGSASYYQEAILHIDLLNGTTPANDVVLDFWVKEYGGAGSDGAVLVSTNGADWITLVAIAGNTTYEHYLCDLDSLGLTYTDDVRIKFFHNSYNAGVFAWDGIRVRVAGPAVEAHTPSSLLRPEPVSLLRFSFDEPMDTSSFAPGDDIVSFDGPTGNLLNQVSGFTWVDNHTLEVQFSAVSTGGLYTMVIGPNITDDAPYRKPMDQDGDGILGEAGDDRYTATFQIMPAIYAANMDTDPGWTFTSGSGNYRWQWGVPAGLGGDPISGHTGNKVVGYNLNGQYANRMGVEYATTPAINTRGYRDVRLGFWRWLGIESGYDHASVEVSNDGTNWTTVWNQAGGTETSWSYQEYNISAVADDHTTVYVRWGMGGTDSSGTYCGWNVDDVAVTGTLLDALPAVDSNMPSGTIRGTSVSSLQFNFSRPMDTTSFSPSADIVDFMGPVGDLKNQVTGYSWLDTHTLQVTFAAQTVPGPYRMLIGPTIVDASGQQPLDQDRDGVPGELVADRYTAQFQVAATIYSANMDTDPGWNFTAGTGNYRWQWGVPAGLSGDPSSGHTGTNVVGYNLNGLYPNGMSVQYATTPAINTRGYRDSRLGFWRWLGIESSGYDHASVQVSNNGTTWTTVWNHASGSFTETSWSYQEYDISSVADNQATVYVRWSLGTTDSSGAFCGWNLDDISITGATINVAPVLTPATPSLGATTEDMAVTIALASFVNQGVGSTTITDADTGAIVGGIAVVGTSGNGVWSYSLDGTNFFGFGSVTATAALLLPVGTQLSYAPDLKSGEITAITYRAWDTTSGSQGTKVDTLINGGITAFSSAMDAASLSVTPVNDAPAGTDKTVTMLEDGTYTIGASDFGLTDPNDSPANALLAVKITTLPAVGSLTLNSVAVTAGQTVTVADINANKLTFASAAQASGTPYASFTFQVQDNGGTAGGGVDLDPTANQFTFNVTPVNDAPAGTDKTVTTLEDGTYTIGASDFDLTDANDSPANTLLAVKITTLPAVGSLKLNSVAVTAGQTVTVADIDANKLTFASAAQASGTPYTSFTFQVQDNGGTAGGGVDLDPTANQFTFNVTAVNDVPVQTAGTLTPIGVAEDSANSTAVTLGLGAVTYGPGGGADESGQTLTYTLTAIPTYVQIFNGATQVLVN
ncbi:MAG: Ig-like domain-containing protein, partial [Planctomycetota bacterium]|nr:Ig-like domain-containing protein [Planctomycetota bacterium]